MKKSISTSLQLLFSNPELKRRVLYTLLLLLVYRIGSYVILPGINTDSLLDQNDRSILGLINMFAGGAFSRASIFALGVMPYISASIIMQLLSISIPFFQRLQREGESGKRIINQSTRALTVLIALLQGFVYLKSFVKADMLLVSYGLFVFSSLIFITAGTLFVVWLGEKITDNGIGNGISVIIMIGIVARLPVAFFGELYYRISRAGGIVVLIIELTILALIIMGIILLVKATRNVPLSYAKQYSDKGSSVRFASNSRQYLPLKVNSAGVMPIIFAQAFMFIPSAMASLFKGSSNNSFFMAFRDYGSFSYNIIFSLLIVLFTFLYTAVSINSNTIAANLQKSNSFIPGIKPGKSTAKYIDNILSRLTLFGALYLAVIAFIPAIAIHLGVDHNFAQFFGGTSLLIIVGVVIDTKQQFNSYMLFNKYNHITGSKLRKYSF